MKILFSPAHYVFDEIYGGSEFSWAFHIADALASKNKGSTVITGYTKIKGKKSYPIIEVQKGKETIDLSGKNALIFSMQYTWASMKELRHKHYDILHHVLPYNIEATSNIAALMHPKIPFVLGPIQSPLQYSDDDLNAANQRDFSSKTTVQAKKASVFSSTAKACLSQFSLLTMKRADEVIVINDYSRQLLINKDISEKHITIIPPGIDKERFFLSDKKKKNTKILSLITVSYLLKRKGIELILQSLAEVKKKRNDFFFTIIGDGPQRESLRKLTHDYHLDDHVGFLGFIQNDKIQEAYTTQDVFVSMSRAEGFATVCLEALASGLPVIASKAGGYVDAIHEGENGFLIDQEDTKMLTKQILFLLEHKDIVPRLAKNARETIKKEYDWKSVIIPKYQEIYNKVIER